MKQRAGSFYLQKLLSFLQDAAWNHTEFIFFFFFTIYIDTPEDAPVGEIYGSLKHGLVHSENVPNVILR